MLAWCFIVVTTHRIFPRALAEMSLIFCGAKNGRIAIWSVPWAGGSSAYVGLTPMLPLAEIADVVCDCIMMSFGE